MNMIVVTIVALLISGCATKLKPVASFTCPTLKQYSKAEQNLAARELADIGAKIPNVSKLVADYRNLRRGIRSACS